ncbi:class I SAM-dependent methyltransferase [Microbacterium sp. C5A9]|uniref:class I SAM-dependent methyltransferase n=1 Tax=Microbacterium sp. C5A9 TaxID=2736663 RepID=UPI001F523B6E|nr:class I SAM-dependent methyltransferase [Microbacterium sp. C5A9]MCI1017896.1 class I SAM-dependent methyltransferase [Microbacterium sp. C5A9]
MKDWAGTGRAYADSYASLCVGTVSALRESLGDPAGRRLLDVGSGTGLLASALTDAGWDVTGCEPEPTMRTVSQHDHPALTVRDGALPHLPFADGSFDAVVANFVLNHVADPRASAAELARVSSDRLAATIWTTSPTWLWREVCERAGLTPEQGERLSPEKDFERTVGGFEAMLTEAGWHVSGAIDLTWTWHADPTALWISAEGGVGGAGLFFRALAPAGRVSFRRAFDAVCAERSVDGLVPLLHSAAVAVGSPR